jgi:TPR repeat protein
MGGEFGAAAKAFTKLAEQGHTKAHCYFGLMYANGEGLPQERVEAVRWYRKATEQGYAKARFNLRRLAGDQTSDH